MLNADSPDVAEIDPELARLMAIAHEKIDAPEDPQRTIRKLISASWFSKIPIKRQTEMLQGTLEDLFPNSTRPDPTIVFRALPTTEVTARSQFDLQKKLRNALGGDTAVRPFDEQTKAD
ncbi:hypothetical protein K8942_04295 [Candidatus Peribacteria bacterium]|nr:MAG: hypothetical protein K8942_04295 [Candidatus Peribacteria bacterium]